jgi:hypothetical protein
MRNLVSSDTPNLFSPEVVSAASAATEEPIREETTPYRIARDFVKWCFSFGSDFRNSPDVSNLRYWLNKTKVESAGMEEHEVLTEARRIYMKRVEQSVSA